MRALLHPALAITAALPTGCGKPACCADQHRELESVQPVRPLDACSGLMAGFANAPAGFKE
jgi:hypothetical protein